MKQSLSLIAVTTLAVSALALPLGPQRPAYAEQEPAAGEVQGSIMGGEMVSVTAVVEAIDLDKREVTLKGPEGNVVTVTVGPEVRNLAQVKVGDTVTVQYHQALMLSLDKAGSGIRERTEGVSGARAAPGEKPGGAVTRTVEVVATIQAIDAEKRTVTLRGPKRTVTVKVPEEVNLDNLKVGDTVRANYVQELAVVVEPAPTD
jgi:Cu/Ag efflux protein CusF